MRTEALGTSYLAGPDGSGPFPGLVVVHELFGLNEHIRDICRRLAARGYVALGVDLFAGHNKTICMARMFVGTMLGDLNYYGVASLKAALSQLAERPDVDGNRIGAVGFCLGGSVVLTWACSDRRLKAIAPYYGLAPRSKETIRRLCPVVGSWPGRDFTTGAAATIETELSATGTPHDVKVYPGTKHAFFNDTIGAYDAAAAADSWQRVLAFFDEHVKRGGAGLSE
ncbi:MAG TPA: dienelactone hydrolase family protein [Chloroflexota bacterium]|jgi:carboxymethylenebutenolidase